MNCLICKQPIRGSRYVTNRRKAGGGMRVYHAKCFNNKRPLSQAK